MYFFLPLHRVEGLCKIQESLYTCGFYGLGGMILYQPGNASHRCGNTNGLKGFAPSFYPMHVSRIISALQYSTVFHSFDWPLGDGEYSKMIGRHGGKGRYVSGFTVVLGGGSIW